VSSPQDRKHRKTLRVFRELNRNQTVALASLGRCD